MSEYAESSGSGFFSLLFWGVIILIAGMIIYGQVVPKGAVDDYLSGKSSSLNNNNSQKCKTCGSAYDVSGGYCANCRRRMQKERHHGR